jgi:multidrug efflux system outer membrane protein
VADYQAVLARGLRDVADGVVAVRTERSRLDEARATVDLWVLAAGQQRLREGRGLSDGVERMSVATSLLLARSRVAMAEGRLADAQVMLARALGGGWAPPDALNGGRQG